MVVVEAMVISIALARLVALLEEGIKGRFDLAFHAKRELRKLKATILKTEKELQKAGKMSSYSQAMLTWLQEIQDAADEAAILLDSSYPVPGYLIPLSKIVPSIRTPVRDIKDIREQMEALLSHVPGEGTTPTVAAEKESDPTPPPQIYERDEAKREIVRCLLDAAGQEPVSVIPIVGIPGIGKTTLAKAVFNDESVKEAFEDKYRIWVWVSGGFNVMKIVQAIIEDSTRSPTDGLNLNQTKLLLKQILSGGKFLLVLDNVWDDEGNWEDLKQVLEAGHHGSKVIVTTCRNRIATTMRGATMPLKLEGLTESTCWSIFEKIALRGRRDMSQCIEKNGREIAHKSEGLPRAAEALGRLMLQKTEETEWISVKNSKIWELSEDTEILPSLRLSYRDLPPHSYQCLAYCSIFPKDHEIDKQKLIKLWIAHDFLPSDGRKDLEETGNDTFKLFLDRFFFQPLQTDKDRQHRASLFLH